MFKKYAFLFILLFIFPIVFMSYGCNTGSKSAPAATESSAVEAGDAEGEVIGGENIDEKQLEDADFDGVADLKDNCSNLPNAPQLDSDSDGLGDSCDNCPYAKNFNQKDSDNDGDGDECDADDDNDGVVDNEDNCVLAENQGQADSDNDGIGDICDTDADNDGVKDESDNCLDVANPNQADADNDGFGDMCDTDADNDGILNEADNCLLVSNMDQIDTDKDGVGDVCVDDADGDKVTDAADNCPMISNFDQKDMDEDDSGDLCDNDIDDDGFVNDTDNCPLVENSDQTDSDKIDLASLANYWNFDEGNVSKTVIYDAVGDVNGNNHGANINVSGKVGKALRFNGVDGYVDLGPSNNITGDNLQAITILAWTKTSATKQQYILAIKEVDSSLISLSSNRNNGGSESPGYLGFLTMIPPGGPKHKFLTVNNNYNDGRWHHIAAVVDGQNRRLYIDGVKLGEDSEGIKSVSGNNGNALIGGFRSDFLLFTGKIDELMIFRSALSESEIQKIYSSSLTGEVGYLNGDGKGDVCDNCANMYNPDQSDADENGIGDVCEGR